MIAEEVAKVNPDLVILDKAGNPYTVRYDQVCNMMLNEFLKEHEKVEDQQASITGLKSTVAQQQKGIDFLTAQLKQQAAQIQKVSAQLQVSKLPSHTCCHQPVKPREGVAALFEGEHQGNPVGADTADSKFFSRRSRSIAVI